MRICVHIYIYIYLHIHTHTHTYMQPEALDCTLLVPPEAWSGLTPDPPNVIFEPRTSCIREPTLSQLCDQSL